MNTRRPRISSLRSERDMLEYDLDHSPQIGWHADMLRNYLADLNAEIARRLAEHQPMKRNHERQLQHAV